MQSIVLLHSSCGCYRGKHLYCHESVLGAICGSLYYHEVDFGVIGGVLYCHQIRLGARGGQLDCHAIRLVVIDWTFYYYHNSRLLHVDLPIATALCDTEKTGL